MFTIFRRVNLIKQHFKLCETITNIQVTSFSSEKTPVAIKRKKAKSSEPTVRAI